MATPCTAPVARNRANRSISRNSTRSGWAGGLKLYGFAAGDPVNMVDPMGTCPKHKTGRSCLSPLRSGRGTAVNVLTIRSDANGDGAYEASRKNAAGERYEHAGVDVNAAVGVGVAAVDEGKVIDICRPAEPCAKKSMGAFVMVQHYDAAGNPASTSTYGHLSEVNAGLQLDFMVFGGTRLGRVGLTGNAAGTNSHLHVEIRDATGATLNAQDLLGAIRVRP